VRILAIRLARFGDLVLLFPALNLLKNRLPGSHLTLLTDMRWGPLAEMCPAIDEIVTVDRIRMRDGSAWRAVASMIRLVKDLRRRHFDMTIDFHGFRETNLLTWWSGAPERWGLKRFDQSFFSFCFNRSPVLEDKRLHASESFLKIVQTVAPDSSRGIPLPPLVVPSDALQWARETLPSQSFVALFVGGPVPERMWPLDRFIDLANRFVTDLGGSVVVVGNPGQVLQGFGRDVQVFANLPVSHLAAMIASARLLVSNDTGPMHLGPALGTPTVGIFSVGIPTHFRPTGAGDRYVQGNPIEEVGVDEVLNAAKEAWATTGRQDR
jgi:lipopolysaccharide heptosyltransferase I